MKNSMKKMLFVSVALIFVLCGSAIATLLISNTAVAEEDNNVSTINVSGTGKVSVAPDIAYISLGVRTENKDAKEAQKENSSKMNKVLKAIKDLGVDEKDVQTNQFNMYPLYQYNNEKNGERTIDKYVVENTVEVTVRDLDLVGTLIDQSVEQGVNVSNAIRFSIADPEQAYQDALVKAIENAKGKATVIADTLDVNISKPKSVTEQGSYAPPVYYNRSMMDTAVKEEAATPISAGELEITASVSVVYEY